MKFRMWWKWLTKQRIKKYQVISEPHINVVERQFAVITHTRTHTRTRARACTCACTSTHTQTHNHFTALWILSGTNGVSRYQKKHSPTHTYRGHQLSLIRFLHLLRSMESSLFNLRAWHLSTISLQVFFGLPLGLAPSTSYSIHFFIQSLSSFCSTCPYNRNLFCCSTEIMSSNRSLSLNPLLGTLSCSLTTHIHLTILIWGSNYI